MEPSVCHSEHNFEEGEQKHTPQQLNELEKTEISIKMSSDNLDELVGEMDSMLDMNHFPFSNLIFIDSFVPLLSNLLTLTKIGHSFPLLYLYISTCCPYPYDIYTYMFYIDLFAFAIYFCYFIVVLQNQRKTNVVKELDHLRERINKEGADSAVQKLICLMTSLKDLERQEDHFQSNRDSKHSELLAEISELESKRENDYDSKSLSDGLDHSFSELLERLHLMKKQLAARLRDIVALRRQIDDLPCQSEIIQYEHRLSELYTQIQGKHRQTRKYYATYNALLEIKELMLKETSLLNSIISQFQEAFSSTDGRVKLVHSMEGIVKGSQQKLEKVQLGFREEERILNDLKDRHTAAAGEQKRCYSLMKAFQVKCAKNDRVRREIQSENC